jgi:hypothetical protein
MATYNQYVGESERYSVDFADKCSVIGANVNSATWSVAEGDAVITSQQLVSNKTFATITTNSEGCSLIKIVAPMSDSETIDIHYFIVNSTQPKCPA